jgi:tetratricopeptide (TPR) repeat protein
MLEVAGSGEIRNVLGGQGAGAAVQAGSVHGGVHIHQHTDAGNVAVPRQVPAAPATFVGRQAELEELDSALTGRGDRCGIALITGVGGVGKSALALRWSQRVGDRFPDGQLYANLGAFDPGGPLSPGEVLGRFLRSLGVPPERVPADSGEQAGLFRSMTAGRGLLVVLDNAVSAAQVRPLLPVSAACMVVVTARWRLAALVTQGAHIVALEPLEDQSAVDLLSNVVGSRRIAADADSTSSLVGLCGGLPIALSVAGARLASRPGWTLRRLVVELASEHRRLAGLSGQDDLSVRACFDLSYVNLPEPVARCYRVVGLHPGTQFGVDVVAAALDVVPDVAAGLLDTLVEASLLSETAEGRFQCHDLVRLHADQRAQERPDRDEVRRRIVEWYLAGTRAADLSLTPYRLRPPAGLVFLAEDVVTFGGRDEALDWLETERANLVATIRSAAQVFPELVWLMADAMWPLFLYHRHHADRMEVDRIAVDCARWLENRAFEGTMTRRWALAHFDRDRFDEAAALLRRSLAIAEELNDRCEQAAAWGCLGLVALAGQRVSEAAGFFARELRLHEAGQDSRAIGFALMNLGLAAGRLGQRGEAVGYLRRSSAAFAQIGDADLLNAARVRIELGRALVNVGESEQGALELTSALAEMVRIRFPRGQAQALQALGELAAATGRYGQAGEQLTQALDIYVELGDAEAAQVRRLLGEIPTSHPQPDGAS